MDKRIKEYLQKYGGIPKDFNERLLYAFDNLKFNEKDHNKLISSIKDILKIKWLKLDFVFYFVPQATPRARYSRFTKAFYVKNAFNNNEIFRRFTEECEDLKKLITTSTNFYCDIYIPISPQMSKVEQILGELKLIRPLSKPDWDNAGKTYSDMIQKHLLIDDSLIIDGRVRKYYSFKPRIEINIEFADKYDSKFNKKKVEGWTEYKNSIDKIEEKYI